VGFATELTKQGRTVSLETFRPPPQPLSEDELRTILSACTVFSPNWEEAAAIVGTGQSSSFTHIYQALKHFKWSGSKILTLRFGETGSIVRESVAYCVLTFPTQAVDSVGAGNAFCGALLARLHNDANEPLVEAACHGTVAASYMVEQVGIPPKLPDPVDYEKRLNYVRKRVSCIEG
jgi:sugar/nucleoside kinase (ribokinase family)